MRFSVASRLRSFVFAWQGVRYLIISEHNSRVHLAASVSAVLTGLLLRISADEWLWIALAIGLVWYAEAVNSAIERLADAVTTERDPMIKIAKDCAAAGVLIAATLALLIGLVIFIPHFGSLA
ncbi:MAG: diacylglycerol kinase family protein [Sphingomicrobium sp.]